MSRIANRCPLSLNPPCVSSSPSREREKQIQNAPRRRKKFDSFEIGRLFFSLFLRARARVGKRARARRFWISFLFFCFRDTFRQIREIRGGERKKRLGLQKALFYWKGERAQRERERERSLIFFIFSKICGACRRRRRRRRRGQQKKGKREVKKSNSSGHTKHAPEEEEESARERESANALYIAEIFARKRTTDISVNYSFCRTSFCAFAK